MGATGKGGESGTGGQVRNSLQGGTTCWSGGRSADGGVAPVHGATSE